LQVKAYAAPAADKPFAPHLIERREPGPHDVEIAIEFCGVCHSDLHTARSEWPGTQYPCVPGHEIIGRITRVGAHVSKFKPGQRVGVGCMVDSCQHCSECDEGLEQYCLNGFVGTYNGPTPDAPGWTMGGYSGQIVVSDKFVLSIPDNLDSAAAAPLLCAGITTFSPLRHWKVKAGDRVGVVGLGGLGHMAVKLAHAMLSRDPEQMKNLVGSLDFILNTVAAAHDLDPFINCLKRDGTMTLVGVPATPHPSPSIVGLIFKRRQVAGSLIGGIAETQEMLDFCGEHSVAADIEIIPIQKIDEAYERMLKGDVKYRFVIDMRSLAEGA
jgi:uncharacterized zinc-type alcohol dehydrogenase-like protein